MLVPMFFEVEDNSFSVPEDRKFDPHQWPLCETLIEFNQIAHSLSLHLTVGSLTSDDVR